MLEFGNHLSSTSYSLMFKTPSGKDVACDVQRFTHPTFVTQNVANYVTPRRTIPVPGDTFTTDPLNVSMILDEDLDMYKEIHQWMRDNVVKTDANNFPDKLVDIILQIRTNKGNVTRDITYHDAFPITLSAIQFDATDQSDQYLTSDVTFEFSHFTIS